MLDASAIFAQLRRRTDTRPLRALFGPHGANLLTRVLAVAEVEEGGGFFAPLPPRRRPAKNRLRWIIAVRGGGYLPAIGATAADCRATWAEEALFGPDVVDLVACDGALERVTGRLIGIAPVLGAPQESEASFDVPVRVHLTPWSWLRAFGDGVLPIGSEIEVQTWLRACSGGLVAENVAHGEALMKKMRREVPALPPVLVR